MVVSVVWLYFELLIVVLCIYWRSIHDITIFNYIYLGGIIDEMTGTNLLQGNHRL